ncbi:peroxide stress protein YaaA [Pleurocapsa sp. PCC 7319]|uniref:peroxide stress protein YaaA n=1 Tax=Pleurocapsa sp. PCC 7319 TaxID=118161 RepID=UPI00034B7207|nr:peroxide stress protein YaaA [Pleurocapsa sp. PCC 7319]
MLILISPAKTLDFESSPSIDHFTQPDFLSETTTLVEQLRQLSATEISSLMKISDKLGELNASRYQTWQPSFDNTNAKQALLAFKGDVYQGLDVDSFEPQDFDFAQDHLRILSGLYGLLKPLDLIQPYRLEMGTKLAHSKLKDLAANNLYDYWQDKLTQAINLQLEQLQSKTIVNLASNEYFKAVKPKLLQGNIITPIFKDWKNGKYKIISFYAKKARGMMAAHIIKNQLQNIQGIKNFCDSGYAYDAASSDEHNFIFIRQ